LVCDGFIITSQSLFALLRWMRAVGAEVVDSLRRVILAMHASSLLADRFSIARSQATEALALDAGQLTPSSVQWNDTVSRLSDSSVDSHNKFSTLTLTFEGA
jgi:hypothetical protein